MKGGYFKTRGALIKSNRNEQFLGIKSIRFITFVFAWIINTILFYLIHIPNIHFIEDFQKHPTQTFEHVLLAQTKMKAEDWRKYW
jgi:hypothetical protein